MFTVNKKKFKQKPKANKKSLSSRSSASLHIKMINGSHCRTPFRGEDFCKFLYLLFT